MMGPDAVTCWPLMVAARWNRPFAAGVAIRVAILAPPPDCPKTMTRSGAPPKAAILSRTQRRARIRSNWPTLPESSNPAVSRAR
ncbi:hypothetical protein D3C85_1262390 [compost metagenome]